VRSARPRTIVIRTLLAQIGAKGWTVLALRSGLRRTVGTARWYVRELLDESAYDRYVAHARSHDPAVSVRSRREFERMRTDRQESDRRGGFHCS
jgi:uncharacterized short protein YbdD (DUF466 family)